MRVFIVTLLSLMALSGASYAETIQVGVHGMVCAFCATGVEKSFMRQPGVESVAIDLEAKRVTVTTKDGQMVDDDAVRKIITHAGYTVTEIKRAVP